MLPCDFHSFGFHVGINQFREELNFHIFDFIPSCCLIVDAKTDELLLALDDSGRRWQMSHTCLADHDTDCNSKQQCCLVLISSIKSISRRSVVPKREVINAFWGSVHP